MTDRENRSRPASTNNIELDIPTVARWLAELDEDLQTKFLAAFAKELATNPRLDLEAKLYSLSGHIKNCECSSDELRHVVKTLAYQIEHSEVGEVVGFVDGRKQYSPAAGAFLRDLMEFRRSRGERAFNV
jgi:hypothetical protein